MILNTGPLDSESSALTTRSHNLPRALMKALAALATEAVEQKSLTEYET